LNVAVNTQTTERTFDGATLRAETLRDNTASAEAVVLEEEEIHVEGAVASRDGSRQVVSKQPHAVHLGIAAVKHWKRTIELAVGAREGLKSLWKGGDSSSKVGKVHPSLDDFRHIRQETQSKSLGGTGVVDELDIIKVESRKVRKG
jgi:hypothetical protein